ncbi:hypothetical protein ACNSOP_09100 [Aliarcobacter lanthieri]|uniref:hypothetical protein n=1 Tax=Aliarcobacter lanthieri TaxID=1355374 RepID=UPI003AA7B494
MRVLTYVEKREFEKTYSFLQDYIGTASFSVKSPYRIKIDGEHLSRELLDFINVFEKVNDMPELGFESLKGLTGLAKINLIFANTNEKRKDIAMQKLINYCFKKQVQPYKLRAYKFKSVTYEDDYKEPTVTAFEGV